MRDQAAGGLFYDEAAERAAIGAALENDAALSMFVRELAPEDFFNLAHARIASVIRSLHAAGHPVDAVTVSHGLGDNQSDRGCVYACVESVPAVSAMAEYVSIVRDTARRRRLDREIQRAQAELARGDDDGEARSREIIAAALAQQAPGTPASRVPFVDWPVFFAREHTEEEWTFPDVLARGRGHAIYARHKEGKSLLALWIAAKLATGADPVVVCYLDFEMSETDLRERLEDMGYGPSSGLSRLRYGLLPTLPPLDSAEGAAALTAVLDRVQTERPDHHLVVVIDTIGRAVSGEEDRSDTIRDFYRHTGIELKRRHCTWVRLDHAGKESSQGQRGTSAKGDDVDVVWKLTKTENGVQLQRELARMSWVPERVTFKLCDDPLNFVRLESDWPAGTDEVAYWLDKYGVALSASGAAAMKILRENGQPKRRQLVLAALRWRRMRAEGSS